MLILFYIISFSILIWIALFAFFMQIKNTYNSKQKKPFEAFLKNNEIVIFLILLGVFFFLLIFFFDFKIILFSFLIIVLLLCFFTFFEKTIQDYQIGIFLFISTISGFIKEGYLYLNYLLCLLILIYFIFLFCWSVFKYKKIQVQENVVLNHLNNDFIVLKIFYFISVFSPLFICSAYANLEVLKDFFSSFYLSVFIVIVLFAFYSSIVSVFLQTFVLLFFNPVDFKTAVKLGIFMGKGLFFTLLGTGGVVSSAIGGPSLWEAGAGFGATTIQNKILGFNAYYTAHVHVGNNWLKVLPMFEFMKLPNGKTDFEAMAHGLARFKRFDVDWTRQYGHLPGYAGSYHAKMTAFALHSGYDVKPGFW